MSTGTHHYKKAEENILDAALAAYGSEYERYLLARAQIHATLALVAATAEAGGLTARNGDLIDTEWARTVLS